MNGSFVSQRTARTVEKVLQANARLRSGLLNALIVWIFDVGLFEVNYIFSCCANSLKPFE